MSKQTPGVAVSCMVGLETREPLISLQVTDDSGTARLQMSPEEAREVAGNILEAAESAETDAFIVDWLKTTVKVDDDRKIATMLKAFRDFRDGRRLLNR